MRAGSSPGSGRIGILVPIATQEADMIYRIRVRHPLESAARPDHDDTATSSAASSRPIMTEHTAGPPNS